MFVLFDVHFIMFLLAIYVWICGMCISVEMTRMLQFRYSMNVRMKTVYVRMDLFVKGQNLVVPSDVAASGRGR